MNIFQNAELGVEKIYRTKKGVHPDDPNMSTAALIHRAINNADLESRRNVIREMYSDFDNEIKNTNMRNLIGDKYLSEARTLNAISNLSPVGKNILFKDILFEFFYKSIPLDESFISTKKNVLKNITDKYIDDNGGYRLLENTINKTNSVLLKRMKSSIDKIVSEACKRKIEECKEDMDPDMISFNLNDEEQEGLDYCKQELGMDEITDLVKNKVLSVVKDEKEQQDAQAELIEDIETDLQDNDEVTDEESANEAFSRIMVDKVNIEDSTLFNSIMRNSYKDYLAESVTLSDTQQINSEEDDDFRDSYGVDDEINDVDDVDSIEDDECADCDDNSIDMDIILSEAVTQYTLMETLYTLKFEDYSHNNIKNLVNTLLNRK